MNKLNVLLGVFGLIAVVSLPAGSASAQSIRTYVSGLGNDVNPCSRLEPCRSLANAITKTLPNGEINCIDADGFGVVTITKSITIDCAGTYGSSLFSGVTGIIVNAAAGDKVALRNLSFNGAPSTMNPTLGAYGIHYISAGSLHIERVTIENFASAGILVDKAAAGILTVRNASFARGATGIKLQSSVPNVVASISDSTFNNLALHGVDVGANSYAAVSNSVFAALNGTAILASTATSTVYAENNMISNTGIGIGAAVAGAKINANGNSLYGNSKAFNVVAGATFLSGGGNKYDINPGNPATGSLGWK